MSKRSRSVFENDAHRVQHKVNSFSTWHVPNLSTLTGKRLKSYLVFVGIEDASSFLEAKR